MGLFEDVSRFLEDRLEEFLRNNPHLELQALEEQLQQQEGDAVVLVADLQRQEQRLKDDIIATAKEVQLWHGRIEKARSANRQDLLRPAQEREAALLRQGNQLWGQMTGVKERIQKTQELIRQIQIRRKEVQIKVVEAQVQRKAQSQTPQTPPGNAQTGAQPGAQTNAQTGAQAASQTGWNQGTAYRATGGADPLEDKFRRWEMDEELEQLKRDIRS